MINEPFNIKNLVDVFANKTISFGLHEALPKDKSAPLGSAEISLFQPFLTYFQRDDLDTPVPECPLSISRKITINYINPKNLTSNQESPSITVEISLSRPLLSSSLLSNSVFMSIITEDIRPIPEEWSLRDGSEKDVNSSNFLLN